MSEADASLQVELDSGKRVKVKSANVLLEVRATGARRAAEPGTHVGRRHRPGPGLGVRARGRVRLCRPGPRLFPTPRPAPCSRPPHCSACTTRRHYFRRAGKGQFKKAPEETVKAALLGIEAQAPAGVADRVLGRRPGERHLPAAPSGTRSTRSSSSRQERPGIQGRRGGQQALAQGAAGPAAAGRRDHQRLPVPLEALPVRELPQGHGLPRADGAGDQGRAGVVHRAGLLHRRLADHRDRRRAVGAGPGHRHGHLRRAHRRARPGHHAGLGRRQGRPRAAVHRLHAGLEADHAARRCRAGLHADRGPRLPGRLHLLHDGRGDVRDQVAGDEAGARAHRRQPAPRQARRHRHRRHAVGQRHGRLRVRARTRLHLAAGQASQGPARGGARQAGELQPARLQLPPRRRALGTRPTAPNRSRSACAPAVRHWT